jgi:hypothetical protein
MIDGEIVEQAILSMTKDKINSRGINIYAPEYVSRRFKYIWIFDNESNTNAPASFEATTLTGGVVGAASAGDIQNGYDLFGNADDFSVDIVMDGGNQDVTSQQYIIDNITSVKKDSIAVISVPKAEFLGMSASDAVDACVAYKDTLARTSSYAALYCNAKYQYDRFNDKYRWVGLSGDVAGVFATVDAQLEQWFAPAGEDYPIKNATKFAFTPGDTLRKVLFRNNINPVMIYKGTPQVFTQLTLYNQDSVFSRIDARRLFIRVENDIADFAWFLINKKNVGSRRKQFVDRVKPYLRRIQSQDGIEQFQVVCDSSNNTDEVKDAKEFVADIYIDPTESIETVKLNFVATRSGVSFSELVRPRTS